MAHPSGAFVALFRCFRTVVGNITQCCLDTMFMCTLGSRYESDDDHTQLLDSSDDNTSLDETEASEDQVLDKWNLYYT